MDGGLFTKNPNQSLQNPFVYNTGLQNTWDLYRPYSNANTGYQKYQSPYKIGLESMLSSLGGLATGGLSTAANFIFSTAGQLINNALQRRQAKFAFNQNKQMWDLQNQYNAPAAQMERLRAAGLNPLLAYGKGPQNTSQSLPRYQAAPQGFQTPEIDLYRPLEIMMAMRKMNLDQLEQVEKINSTRLRNAFLDKTFIDRVFGQEYKTGYWQYRKDSAKQKSWIDYYNRQVMRDMWLGNWKIKGIKADIAKTDIAARYIVSKDLFQKMQNKWFKYTGFKGSGEAGRFLQGLLNIATLKGGLKSLGKGRSRSYGGSKYPVVDRNTGEIFYNR